MNNHAKLGMLLPAILNPATAAIVGIAAMAVGLYRMLPDDEKDATVGAVSSNGSKQPIPTVEARLPAVELDDVQRGCQLSGDGLGTVPVVHATVSTKPSDDDESAMIRKAMSELGKRSAVARAKKKAERGDVST
ncbi:hypothetical protein [Yoonia sp. TsM2_T14_4]|uniref:hypothetical protein n=1 Tax=Yoonia sp. TsM2_T14_4 TaxID=3415141 RepID=UPI003C787886